MSVMYRELKVNCTTYSITKTVLWESVFQKLCPVFLDFGLVIRETQG